MHRNSPSAIKISIVMPVYNTGPMVRDTIDSVLAQTFTDFEFIIVDDGSRPETSDIVKSYTDPRIRYYSQENRGMAATRNRGIELAQGEYIAFLDHDDIWLPEKLAEQINVFEAFPETRLVYSPVIFFDEQGREWRQDEPVLNGQVFVLLLRANVIKSCSCVMVPRCLFENESFRFRSECVPCDDYDLWLLIAMVGPIRCNEKPLVRYRIHQNNASNNSEKMFNAKMNLLKLTFPRIAVSDLSFYRKFILNLELRRTIAWLYRERADILLVQAGQSAVALKYAMKGFSYGWFNPRSMFLLVKVLKKWFKNRISR